MFNALSELFVRKRHLFQSASQKRFFFFQVYFFRTLFSGSTSILFRYFQRSAAYHPRSKAASDFLVCFPTCSQSRKVLILLTQLPARTADWAHIKAGLIERSPLLRNRSALCSRTCIKVSSHETPGWFPFDPFYTDCGANPPCELRFMWTERDHQSWVKTHDIPFFLGNL